MVMLNRISNDLFFLDVRLSCDVDFSVNHVLSIFWAKLHRKICDFGMGKVALAFPEYSSNGLGKIIRLFSSAQVLNSIQESEWKGIRDFLEFKEVLPIPENVNGYATFARKQLKSSNNKRKRLINHFHFTEDEALEKFPFNENERKLSLPFAKVKSLSTDCMVPIFVEMSCVFESENTSVVDFQKLSFTTYGLSREIAVPIF